MATLKNLVDETTNIKNELKTCYANLVTNLVEKGVDVSSGDKLSALVDKIPNIKQSYNVITGDNIVLYEFSSVERDLANSKRYKYDIFCPVNGSFRFNYAIKSTSGAYAVICEMSIIRDGIIINTVQEKTYKSTLTSVSKDFDEVQYGDIFRIEFYHSRSNQGGTAVLKNITYGEVV